MSIESIFLLRNQFLKHVLDFTFTDFSNRSRKNGNHFREQFEGNKKCQYISKIVNNKNGQ